MFRHGRPKHALKESIRISEKTYEDITSIQQYLEASGELQVGDEIALDAIHASLIQDIRRLQVVRAAVMRSPMLFIGEDPHKLANLLAQSIELSEKADRAIRQLNETHWSMAKPTDNRDTPKYATPFDLAVTSTSRRSTLSGARSYVQWYERRLVSRQP